MTDFDRFWAAYPRRVAKLAAQRAWAKQQPPLDAVLATLAWQVPLWADTDPRFIPHASTWIHVGRWMDEPPVARVDPETVAILRRLGVM